MRYKVAALAVAFLATAAQSANIRKEFAGIWSARETSYATADQAADKNERDTAVKFIEVAKADGPTLVDTFQVAMAAIRAHGEATARLKLLKEFEAFMATKPSGAASQAWMQGKIDEIQRAAPGAAAEEERLNKVKIGVDEPTTQWIGEKAKATSVSGMFAGLIGELTLIDENLRAYYQGRATEEAQAAQNRARWLAVLGAMGRSLQANAAAAPRPFTMMCTRTGPFTNCNGTR